MKMEKSSSLKTFENDITSPAALQAGLGAGQAGLKAGKQGLAGLAQLAPR